MSTDYTLTIYDQVDEYSTREIYESDKPILRFNIRSTGPDIKDHHLLVVTRNGGVIELKPTEDGKYEEVGFIDVYEMHYGFLKES